jgi:hypothetical protein
MKKLLKENVNVLLIILVLICLSIRISDRADFFQECDSTFIYDSIGDFPNYGSFAPSTTSFVSNVVSSSSAQSGVSKTNIGIQNIGTNIQSIDPYSNVAGVNITPPFFSVNFYINI